MSAYNAGGPYGHGPGLPAVSAAVPARPTVAEVLAAARPRSDAPDAFSLLKALRRRWKPALSLGLLLGAAAAAAAWAVIPSAKYTARAILHVSTVPPKLVFEHDNETDYRTYQQTQMALINSRLVLSAALSEPAVKGAPTVTEQPDPVEWLEKQIVVKFPGGSEILEISLSGDRPADLPVVVNAVVRSYIFNMVEKEARDRKHRYTELRKIYDRHQEVLEAKRKGMKRLAESVGSGDRTNQALMHQLALQLQNRYQGEMLEIQSGLRKAQVEASSLEAAAKVKQPAPDWQVDARVEQEPAVQELRAKLASVNRQYAQVAKTVRYPKTDPACLDLAKKYHTLLRDLESTTARYRAVFSRQIAGSGEQVQQERLAEARDKVKTLKTYEAILAAEIKAQSDQNHSLNRETLDLQSLLDEIQLMDETSRKVGMLMKTIEVEVEAPARIRLLDGATTPKSKDDKKKIRMAGMTGLGSLAFVVLGISFWEYQARRLDGSDQIVKSLGVRLMGELPMTNDLRRGYWDWSFTPRDRDPLSQLVESVNATRAQLLHASREESLRVVMVTSALKGEGKTSLSVHLATSLAFAGRRTLLIDCDLRSPAAHRLFDLPASPGLCDLLRGERTADEVLRPTVQKNLTMITAGVADSRALQALAQADLEATFAALRRDFDFIIVDSPPVLPVADALLISQHVDAVILSTLRDVSRIPRVREAHDRLAALGVRVLGAVVHGAANPSAYY